MSEPSFLPAGLDGDQAKFVTIDARTAYAVMAALVEAQSHRAYWLGRDESWKCADYAAADAFFRTAWVDAPCIEVATLRLKD